MWTRNPSAKTFLLALAAVLIFIVAPLLLKEGPETNAALVTHTASTYRQLERRMLHSLDVGVQLTTDSSIHDFLVHKGMNRLGFIFFFYEKGNPVAWSGNETDLDDYDIDTLKNATLLNLQNGTYVFFKKGNTIRTVAGLLLLKRNYSYQNQYLVNEFNPYFHLPPNTDLAEPNAKESMAVRDSTGKEIFRVQFPDAVSTSGTALAWWQAVAIFFLFLAIASIQKTALVGKETAVGYIISLLAARYLMIEFHWPHTLYESLFFSPQLYASSFWFNSPGDLLLNVALLLLLASGFFGVIEKRQQSNLKASAALLPLLFLWLLSVLLNSLLSGLIVNSRISFDASNLFLLDQYTLAGVFIIAMLLFSYFFFVRGVIMYLRRGGVTLEKILPWLGLAAAICYLSVTALRTFTPLTIHYSWMDIAFAAVLILCQFLPAKKISLNFLLLNILFFALYAAAILRGYNQHKELVG
jgi:hypothetical protein